jgi:hypothetical protein
MIIAESFRYDTHCVCLQWRGLLNVRRINTPRLSCLLENDPRMKNNESAGVAIP